MRCARSECDHSSIIIILVVIIIEPGTSHVVRGEFLVVVRGDFLVVVRVLGVIAHAETAAHKAAVASLISVRAVGVVPGPLAAVLASIVATVAAPRIEAATIVVYMLLVLITGDAADAPVGLGLDDLKRLAPALGQRPGQVKLGVGCKASSESRDVVGSPATSSRVRRNGEMSRPCVAVLLAEHGKPVVECLALNAIETSHSPIPREFERRSKDLTKKALGLMDAVLAVGTLELVVKLDGVGDQLGLLGSEGHREVRAGEHFLSRSSSSGCTGKVNFVTKETLFTSDCQLLG
jgi:hypothetical protein